MTPQEVYGRLHASHDKLERMLLTVLIQETCGQMAVIMSCFRHVVLSIRAGSLRLVLRRSAQKELMGNSTRPVCMHLSV